MEEIKTENKLERISNGLKQVKEAFESIKKIGIDKGILIAYLHDYTKLPKRDIQEILYAQEDFYKRISEVGKRVDSK